MRSLIPWKKKNEIGRGESFDRNWHPLARFEQDFSSLMDRFWHDWPSFGQRGSESRWGFDVEDNDGEYLVRAEAPGFDVEDFDIHVSGNQLVLHAERKQEKEENGGKSYSFGSIHRSFQLPHGVAEDGIEANYQKGVLEVRLPKTEEARGKKIEVKTT